MSCHACKDGARLRLTVNDQPVELNDFVAAMVRETVLGMLRPLRGLPDPVEKIELVIERAGG